MTWLIVILVVALIGGIIGFFVSDGEPEGCLAGALQAGGGCGMVILQIFLWGLAIAALIALFRWLFG